MKREIFLATFLILIFTAVTIMAGIDPEPPDVDESVSVKVKKGKVYPKEPHKPFKHTFDKVLTLKYSTGCDTVIAAEYYITHKVTAKGKISPGYRGVVTVKTSVEVVDSNGTKQGGNDDTNIVGVASIWRLWRTPFTVSEDHKYTFTTSSAGNYTAKGTGTGSAKWVHKKYDDLEGNTSWNDGTDQAGITVGSKTITFSSSN